MWRHKFAKDIQTLILVEIGKINHINSACQEHECPYWQMKRGFQDLSNKKLNAVKKPAKPFENNFTCYHTGSSL